MTATAFAYIESEGVRLTFTSGTRSTAWLRQLDGLRAAFEIDVAARDRIEAAEFSAPTSHDALSPQSSGSSAKPAVRARG